MKTALIVILALLLIGGGIYAYKNRAGGPEGDGDNNLACTMDAKLCPDGSYVGRIGPDCQFALCPGEPKAVINISGTVINSTTHLFHHYLFHHHWKRLGQIISQQPETEEKRDRMISSALF